MATNYETDYDNIEFSFKVVGSNYPYTFEWNGEEAMQLFHQELKRVCVTIKDNDSRNSWKCRFYISVADWISVKEQRDYFLQVIYKYIKFPSQLKTGDDVQETLESVRYITDTTMSALVDWYKKNNR